MQGERWRDEETHRETERETERKVERGYRKMGIVGDSGKVRKQQGDGESKEKNESNKVMERGKKRTKATR